MIRRHAPSTGRISTTCCPSRTLLLLAWLGAAGLSPGTALAAFQDVAIRNFAFVPDRLTIAAGDTVTWSNQDTAPHTSTSDTGAWGSAILAFGQAYSFTFTQAGDYPYHCAVHPGMKARISVQAQDKPNLTTFWLNGWSDSLVVSTVPGGHQDAVTIDTSQDINVAFAIVNTSTTTDISQTFLVRVSIDGQEQISWLLSGLTKNTWNSSETNNIGKLPAGTHTIKIVIDPLDAVDESNKSDNAYEKQFVVIPASLPAPHQVAIVNFSFQPPNLTIPVGDTVTWTNQDTAPHTATSDGGGWGSTTLAQGQSYSFTFTQAGDYPYHCAVHPGMKAALKVVAPSGGAVSLSTLRRMPDGSTEFTISSPIEAVVTVDTSADLSRWTQLQTVTNHTGTLLYQDPATADVPRRYYRASTTR